MSRAPEQERPSADTGVQTVHPSESAPQDRERTVEDDRKSNRPEPLTRTPPAQQPGSIRSKERSTAHSATIIAGAAAAGAAIGGLAGGGKGAAIGAIAGGRRRLRLRPPDTPPRCVCYSEHRSAEF